MKARRIVQLVGVALGLVVLAVYLVLIHANNPQTILLPFIVPLPTTAVLVLALLLGWGLGWLPSRLRFWRLLRENRQLKRRVEELEHHLPSYSAPRPAAPVIPDRPSRTPSGDQ